MRLQRALEFVLICLVCYQHQLSCLALNSISQPQHQQVLSRNQSEGGESDESASELPTAIISRLRHAEPQVRKLSVRSLNQHQQQQQSNASSAQGPNAFGKLRANSSASCPAEHAAGQQAGALDQNGEPTGNFQFGQQRATFGFVQSRASDFVKPNFYTLRLKVDPNKRKFSGQLMVSLEIGHSASGGAAGNASASGGNQTATPGGQPQAFRYLTLHAGLNLSIKKAFYVFTARNNVQIPATKIGRNLERELLTLDFHPNVIGSSSQGLLLLVYSGVVNETESHGLFSHHRTNHAWGSTKSSSLQQQLKIAQRLALNNSSTSSSSSSPSASSTDEGAKQAAGEQSHLGLATQLEPSFARRLFPCWDEPSLKARFSLIVIQPFRGYESISNMPIKRKSISLSCSGEPLQEVEFQTTPTMSTYLLTLVIGRFEHIESITQNNCKVRAYFYANYTGASATQQQQQQQAQVTNEMAGTAPQPQPQPQPQLATNQRRQAAQMALELAVRSFDRLESLLGVRYPLAKFDMVALRDFSSGAMENWGASIFHENYMLCDNSSLKANIRVNGGTSRPKRLVVPLVVAHEIVHQWFGNLITSRTWTYLWLNEGFAQLLMYEVASELLPNENYWHIFLEDNRQSAMREDELITSSRALELDEEQIVSQDDQMSLFDQLTYNKGAMLLRMCQHALGKRDFMAGLRHYLLKHSYDSVSSHDLWLALEESSERLAVGQLEQLMQSWLKLEGFPLVTVRAFDSADGAHLRLELAQERFTLLPEAATQQAGASGSGSNQSATTASASPGQQPWASWLWSVPMGVASELAPEPAEFELRLWPLRASGQHQTSAVSAAGNSMLLSDKGASLLLPKASIGAWLKLNFNAIGYFRVNYQHDSSSPGSVDLLSRLHAPIRQQTLGPADRLNLLEDLFAMVLSGRKPLVDYLRLLAAAFEREAEPLVLRFIFDSLERARQALVSNSDGRSAGGRRAAAGQQLEELFERYVRNFVRKLIGGLRSQARDMTHQEPGGGEPQSVGMSPRLRAKRRRRTNTPLTVGAANNNQKQQQQQQQQWTMDESWAAFISMEAPLKRQLKQRRLAQANENNFEPADSELLELLDSVRLTYNDAELGARQAADLFARLHFRSAQHSTQTQTNAAPGAAPNDDDEQAANGAAANRSTPFELMGRELRASIYAAALNYHFRQHATATPAPPVDELFPAEPEGAAGPMPHIRNSPPAQLSNYFEPGANDDVTSAPSPQPPPPPSSAQSTGDGEWATFEDRVFNKLLELYETLDGSPAAALERSAIAQALGSARNQTKQAHLLNLTLSTAPAYFRHQDACLLLEALVQSRTGRQLVWRQLNTDIRPLKQRQLLAAALKALSRGLIEPGEQQQPQQQPMTQQEQDANNSNSKNNAEAKRLQQAAPNDNGRQQRVETQLRQLYVIYGAGEHGHLIGQAIEWVRINSLWFQRDHDQLLEFLEQSN